VRTSRRRMQRNDDGWRWSTIGHVACSRSSSQIQRSKATATLSMQGRWFDTPQLHPKVLGSGGGLPGFKIPRLVETDRTARMFRGHLPRRQRSQVRILSGAPIKSMSYDDLAQVVRKPSYHIATSVALIRGHFSLRPCCVLSVGRSPRAWHSTWRLRSGGFLDPKRRRRAAEFASGAACGGTGCDPAPKF
jgi:hypothetical protein